MNRRAFIRSGLAAVAALPASCAHQSGPSRVRKVSVADAFDREVEAFMSARHIPGGSLAVVKDRRLIYARGFGWADRDRLIPVEPDSLFRIASISKPITAVAVMKLVETRKLEAEAKAFELVQYPPALDGIANPDPRLKQITVRQLLQHTGGWDRELSFDPMFRSALIAEKLGMAGPADPAAVIRYMLGQPLDFDPGTRYAYSNFGYCVLGRIIEKLTGQSYEKFVQESVLAPAGIRHMKIGATLDGRQAEHEVRYYMADNSEGNSVFPGTVGKVPWPYGGFNLEAMDAHGGWIASAVDLARFAAAVDEAAASPLLTPATLGEMSAPPPPPVSRREDGSLKESWYGCGWSVRPRPDGRHSLWHSGSLPGTSTLLVRRSDGLSWAVLFNQRSADNNLPDNAIDGALHRAAAAVTAWPDHDLFGEAKFSPTL